MNRSERVYGFQLDHKFSIHEKVHPVANIRKLLSSVDQRHSKLSLEWTLPAMQFVSQTRCICRF